MSTNRHPVGKNNLTAPQIIRWSGVAAMLAGIFFIVIQMIHPTDILSSVNTRAWSIAHYLSITMGILALVGITGIFVRQMGKFGWLGLVGYLLFSLEFVLLTALTFIEAFILPLLTTDAPTFVEGFLGLSSGTGSKYDLGALVAVGPVSAVAYLLGGLLFGIATLRAGVLSRWAAGLLAFGAVASLAAAVLPHEIGRIAAVPMGVGLIWLGYSLWTNYTEANLLNGRGLPAGTFRTLRENR